MALTTPQLINGILAIVTVVISISVGLRIASRYFEVKQRSFLLIGLTWIGLVSIWIGTSVSVIAALIGPGIPDQLYMFIGNGFMPLTSIIAVMGFTDLFYKDKQRVLLILYVVYGIIFEFVFLFYLFTDYTVLGRVNSPVDASYGLFVTVYQVFCLLTFVILGTAFARVSLQSEKREIKLKGKLLLGGIYSFLLGALFDIIGEISIFILVVGRIFLILSSFLSYGGFLLPDLMKKVLLKH